MDPMENPDSGIGISDLGVIEGDAVLFELFHQWVIVHPTENDRRLLDRMPCGDGCYHSGPDGKTDYRESGAYVINFYYRDGDQDDEYEGGYCYRSVFALCDECFHELFRETVVALGKCAR